MTEGGSKQRAHPLEGKSLAAKPEAGNSSVKKQEQSPVWPEGGQGEGTGPKHDLQPAWSLSR